MYSTKTGLILGFHGCDESILAVEFARFLKDNPQRARTPIKTPSVIGAVIDLA
jgi:hypothetical protein